MEKKWIIIGGAVIGFFSLSAFALSARQLLNVNDPDGALTLYAPEQNNLYPNGSITNVGTRMGASSIASTRSPSGAWASGGRSSVTSSTGRWAA